MWEDSLSEMSSEISSEQEQDGRCIYYTITVQHI